MSLKVVYDARVIDISGVKEANEHDTARSLIDHMLERDMQGIPASGYDAAGRWTAPHHANILGEGPNRSHKSNAAFERQFAVGCILITLALFGVWALYVQLTGGW